VLVESLPKTGTGKYLKHQVRETHKAHYSALRTAQL
jgi:hypothetical protein